MQMLVTNSPIFIAGFQLLADITSKKPDEKWYFYISITIPIINGIIGNNTKSNTSNYFLSGIVTPFVSALRPIKTKDGYVAINFTLKTNLYQGVFLQSGLYHSTCLGLNN